MMENMHNPNGCKRMFSNAEKRAYYIGVGLFLYANGKIPEFKTDAEAISFVNGISNALEFELSPFNGKKIIK